MHSAKQWMCAAALALLAWQALPQAQAAERYGDAADQLKGEAEIEAWYGLHHHLERNFDQICGDTFCEGDYSNIQALRLTCSAERANRTLGRCVWTFAASNEAIDPATGRIEVMPKAWRCRLPLAPGTSLPAFLTALAGTQPLYAKLPGTRTSIYDGLTGCL